MIDVAWNIADEDRDAELTGRPRPLLGTWHYLRTALRREWRTWVGLAVTGGLIGFVAMLLLPPASTGTVTILMAHPANLDGPSAISTDVSLLTTREVSARTVEKLGLDMTPDAFMGTISAVPVTTEVLTVSVVAPNKAAAVARAQMLTTQYLGFRAEQLRSLTSGTINGYKSRIASIQDQVNALNRAYVEQSALGAAGQAQATDILTRRAQLNAQITTMQQAIEDATLTTEAAVSSTHVVDPPRAVQHSPKKTLVLDVGSGILIGAAVGLGFVLFRALTSERLRRRQEVALALGAPVRFSVASEGPRGGRLRRLRRRRWGRGRRRGRDLQALVYGLESTVAPRSSSGPVKPTTGGASGEPRGVALAAIGNATAASAIIAGLEARLREAGQTVFLVDLSVSGALVRQLSRSRTSTHRAAPRHQAEDAARATAPGATASAVFRPSGAPGLARGPRGAAPGSVTELPEEDPHRPLWDAADVVLVLVEVDPGIDVENLRSWVDQVVPLVTAGESTAELLETTSDLVRAAGLTLPFAMMIGADESDESLGLVNPSDIVDGAASAR